MRKMISLLIFTSILWSCTTQSQKSEWFVKKEIIYEEQFQKDNMSNWVAEVQDDSCSFVGIKQGKMEIDVCKGASIWLKKQLQGGVLIEYDATVINNGGSNDRVSDLNCFWQATDPRTPQDLFASPRKPSGMFHDYDTLQLYYVGMGGHNNTKTRFRRYAGDGTKPLLEGHDLSSDDALLEPNKTYHIELVALEKRVQFIRDGKVIYDFTDEHPYERGWFGIRTIQNHMTIDNFKIYQIEEKN